MTVNLKIFLLGVFLFGAAKACSDFVFVVDGEADDSQPGRGLQVR